MRKSSPPARRISTARVYHRRQTTTKATHVNAIVGASVAQPMALGATAGWGDGPVWSGTIGILVDSRVHNCSLMLRSFGGIKEPDIAQLLNNKDGDGETESGAMVVSFGVPTRGRFFRNPTTFLHHVDQLLSVHESRSLIWRGCERRNQRHCGWLRSVTCYHRRWRW